MANSFSSETSKVFPLNFFAAVNDSDESLAKDHHREAALRDDGQPSPRMQQLVDEGAWDTQVVVGLCFMEDGCCGGSVGSGDLRFCGKPFCSIAGHKKALREVRPGWYITAGTKAQGYFWEPTLPIAQDGGPITSEGGAFLSMDTGLRMSRGQWQLALEAWHEWNATTVRPARRSPRGQQSVGTPSSLGSSDKSTPSPRVRINPISTAFDDLDARPVSLGDLVDIFGKVESDAFSSPPEVFIQPAASVTIASNPFVAEPRLETAARLQQPVRAPAPVEDHGPVVRDLTRQVDVILLELARTREAHTLLQSTLARERAAFDDTLHHLTGRITALETVPRVDPQLTDTVHRCAVALFGDAGSFANFKLEYRLFKESVESGGGIECHGLKFASGREVASWCESKELTSIAVFVDAMSMLHGITASYVSRVEAGKRLETQGKNAHSNDLEEIVLTSFQTTLPSVFAGGRATADSNSSSAVLKKTMKSYHDWRPKGEMSPGIATEITDGVKELATQIRMYRNEVTSDSGIRDLAVGLLEDARQFCNELVGFVDRQNDALTHNSCYSAEQIWDMQLECLRKILTELSQARRVVVHAARHRPALYLWGMLKAWQIQQRYLENHFKDDPALTGIMVRRIVMQSGQDGTKDKLAKIDKLQDQVADHYRRTRTTSASFRRQWARTRSDDSQLLDSRRLGRTRWSRESSRQHPKIHVTNWRKL